MPDELALLPEGARKLALDRFRILQPHLEQNQSLRSVAVAAGILSPQQQAEIRKMVSKGGRTAADAARLFKIHPATVSRLLGRAPRSKTANGK